MRNLRLTRIFNHGILILILHCSSLEFETQLALPRHSHPWISSRISRDGPFLMVLPLAHE